MPKRFRYNECMNEIKLPELTYVDNIYALDSMMDHILLEPIVAVDTESNSLFAYQERVCLIQLSTKSRDYLVDPIAISDLSRLNDLFSSDHIEKVFHASDYDMVCLKRDFGYEFRNLFDTMIAGRTLGMNSVGLAAMLQTFFNLQVDKRYQRANWGQRPLKDEMLEYARKDSHYLIALRDLLVKKLVEVQRLELVKEECAYLAKHTQPLQNHTADMWRIRGVNQLNTRQQAALQSLYDFREELAKEKNKPPFKIISNQALLEIARSFPKYHKQLENISFLSKNHIHQYGNGLLDAIKRSERIVVKDRENHNRYDDVVQMLKERLNDWRRDKGVSLGVPSDVIISKDMLNKVAEVNPQSMYALKQLLQDLPVRFEHYGREIFDVIKKGKHYEN